MTIPPSLPRRVLVSLPAAVLVAGLLAGCSGSDGEAPADSANPTVSVDPTEHVAENLSEFSYEGQDGRTALELLEENDPDAQVQGKGKNAFVTGVRGHEADQDSEFWALYVDGEPAQAGAGALETKDGQTITWKLEEIK